MFRQVATPSYSTYLKAISVSVFTTSSFLYARASGFLSTQWVSGEGNNNNHANEKREISEIMQSSLIVGNEVGRLDVGDFPIDIEVNQENVFVAAGLSGLVIFDSLSSTLLSSYQTTQYTFPYAYQVRLEGNNAFIANSFAGLMVLDVSNLSQPDLLGNHLLLGALPVIELAITNNKLYVTDGGYAGRMDVFNINSLTQSLFAPVLYTEGSQITAMSAHDDALFFLHPDLGLSLINSSNFAQLHFMNTGVAISDIKVSGNILYEAETGTGLKIFDVSDSKNPLLLATYPTPNAVAFSVAESQIYLVDANRGLFILDVSNLSLPVLLGSYSIVNQAKISVSGTFVYLLEQGVGFNIINVSNVALPTFINNYDSPFASDISAVGTLVYLADGFNGLDIIDVSNPLFPYYLNSYSPLFQDVYIKTLTVLASGTTIFITDLNGFQMISMVNPITPVLLGRYTTINTDTFFLSFMNETVYLAGPTTKRVYTVDISNLVAPQLLNIHVFPNEINTITAGDNKFFTGSQNGDMYSVSTPLWESLIPVNPSGTHLAIGNNCAFVTDVNNVLHVVSYQDPSSLVEISSYQLLGIARDMDVSGDFLYVAEESKGIEVIDIRNPFSLQRAGNIIEGIVKAISVRVVNNQMLYVGDVATSDVIIFNISEKLFVSHNQLTLGQFQVVDVTISNISARDTREIGFSPDISFTVSNVINGQFIFKNNTNQSITQFSQQDILNGLIQFESTNIMAPSYLLSASYKGLNTASSLSSIIFLPVYEMPVMGNNQFFIDEGETNLINSNNLSATVSNSGNNPQIQFTVNNLGNGFFQLASNPNVFISQFSQQDISDNNINFVYLGDGLKKPFFQISAGNGPYLTPFIDANINFDAAPQLLNNRLTIGDAETVVVTAEYLQAFDYDSNNASLIFGVSNVVHGEFFSSTNGVNNTAVVRFIQQDISDGFIRFKHDGSGIAPGYVVSVSDGRITIRNQTPSILFNNKNGTVIGSNTPAIVGGVVSGVAGLGALAAGIGFFVKRGIDKSTRNENRLAAFLWDELQIQGTENFKTAQGKKYISLIKNELEPKLKENGYFVENMEDLDLRLLAKKIAMSARNRVTTKTTFFGASKITVDEFSEKINDIIGDILNGQYEASTRDSISRNDKDEFELKSFMPSFKASSQFETV